MRILNHSRRLPILIKWRNQNSYSCRFRKGTPSHKEIHHKIKQFINSSLWSNRQARHKGKQGLCLNVKLYHNLGALLHQIEKQHNFLNKPKMCLHPHHYNYNKCRIVMEWRKRTKSITFHKNIKVFDKGIVKITKPVVNTGPLILPRHSLEVNIKFTIQFC